MDVLSYEPKLCKAPGDGNDMECPRTHYCCKSGCCITPAFQFYQLWYYWVLVIVMFMLCSGGGWWYRYWLAGRFPGIPTSQVHRLRHVELGTIPRSTDSPLTTDVTVSRSLHRPCVHFSYHPTRHAVMVERIWKVPPRTSQPPPSYTQSECSSQAAYHLYGPPPSYDSIIALNLESAGSATSPSCDVSGSQTVSTPTQLLQVHPSSSFNDELPQQANECTSSSPENLFEDGERQRPHPTVCDAVPQSH